MWMKCAHCGSDQLVMNGKSRHGNQRWLCRECGRTCGESDRRRVPGEKRKAALHHYLEGVGQRATGRLVGVSHNSVMNWVLKAAEGKALAPVHSDEVEIVEADELWSFVGKKADCWLWWAVDRAAKKVCGWPLGDRSTQTAWRLAAQLPSGEHITCCTDFWHPYGIVFKGCRHLKGKAYTFTIESHNNCPRCYLARLRRKTHCYTKKLVNLAASILLYLLKKTSIPI
jgi:IS1 family transposase